MQENTSSVSVILKWHICRLLFARYMGYYHSQLDSFVHLGVLYYTITNIVNICKL